ncbi:MAG: hypothetical protein K2J80_13015 [Oscillospiraceae bacterium]|nr:hypothetical protein [Oscillospiraceae bacterium]
MSIAKIDPGAELNALNENFKANAAKITLPQKPRWLKEEDKLSLLYSEFSQLIDHGSVFWAYTVQANKVLFEKPVQSLFSKLFFPAAGASAAEIVYAHNRPEATEYDPLIMRNFTHYLYECKGKPDEEIPEWLREAAAVITDEYDRSRVIIKAGERDNFSMNLTMQTIIVFREHLPKGFLKCSLLPLIAAPQSCTSTMIFPYIYWTKTFREYWEKG